MARTPSAAICHAASAPASPPPTMCTAWKRSSLMGQNYACRGSATMLAPYTEFTGGNPGPLVPADVCCGRRLRPRVPEERATASRSAVSVGLKSESARMERALSADWSGLRTLAVRAVPCDPRNVRPGDADIGQFAVAELVQLVEARIVAPPGLEEVEDCDQHDLCLSIPGLSRGILVGAKNRVPCCIATETMLRCSYAENAV